MSRIETRARLRVRHAVIVAVGTILIWLPSVANACAVCMSGREEDTRFAFIWTTAFLTAMPLALVGGVILWIRRRVKSDAALPAVPVRSAASVSERARLRVVRDA